MVITRDNDNASRSWCFRMFLNASTYRAQTPYPAAIENEEPKANVCGAAHHQLALDHDSLKDFNYCARDRLSSARRETAQVGRPG
jgi:hypothetical protein